MTANTLVDDESERPTLPSLRPRQRPKIRKKHESVPPRPRFDAHAEHFFSNAETIPELSIAELTRLRDEELEADTSAWWEAQRRRKNLQLVLALCVACVAVLCAGVMR